MGYLKTKPLGYKFRRQHPIGILHCRFFLLQLKLAIEVDGPVHTKEEIKKNDEERQKLIESEGIKVVRFYE